MNFYSTLAKIADNTRAACLEVEDRCSPILVAMCAYPMRWFALAHGFFKSVGNGPWPRGVNLVALLLCFPCFYASDFFFKCAYLLNHRKLRRIGIKCAALGGQNGALKLDLQETTTREAMTERPHPAGMGGVQKLFRFPNGYGASVVQLPHSYGGYKGLWEMAVIRYSGDGYDAFSLTYDTPITDGVIGHLNDQEVDALLDQVAALEAANVELSGARRASEPTQG